MPRFEDLTIKDSFMFYALTRDPEECRKILCRILEMEILEVQAFREDTLAEHPGFHSVRLDVLAVEKNTQRRFNIEMQRLNENDLPKRSRYYHDMLDRDALKTAENYNNLPDTIVIFICDFDPFGPERYRYHFRMMTEDCFRLEDGRDTIFLNTKGKDESAISEDLRKLLKYIGGLLPPEDEDDYIQHLEEQIKKIKQDAEWKGKYMLLELTMKKQFDEGIELGELIKLVKQCQKKLLKNKPIPTIAEELETDEALISLICEEAAKDENKNDPKVIAQKLIDQVAGMI